MTLYKVYLMALLLSFFQNDKFARTDKQQFMKQMLCLGDSYTIGEAVREEDRFPNQLTAQLAKEGLLFSNPEIIAKTGWTTDELQHAIALWEKRPHAATYDVVTLLIGVNNQYRGRNIENYRKEFRELLATAVHYAGGNGYHVFVVSIPDWGVTPFAKKEADKRSAEKIGAEIDAFNQVNQEEALREKVHYVEITKASRLAGTDASLIAEDGLHPSAKMYHHWASLLSNAISKIKF